MTDVDVSVVVGANPALVFECLASFFAHAPAQPSYRVVVTANRPGTDLAASLARRFGGRRIEVVEHAAPRGFADNHNRVLASSSAEFAFVLNDDLIFTRGSIDALLAFMSEAGNADVAMVTPRLLNADGTVQPCTYSFPTVPRALLSVSGLRDWLPFSGPMSRLAALAGRGAGGSRFWAHDRTVAVEAFKGACMLARMAAVRRVGLMHTASLAGGEEIEWHYRLRRAGWRVVFFAGAEVIHVGGETRRGSLALQNEELKSYLYYFAHHRSRAARVAFEAAAFSLLRLRWLAERLRGASAQAAATLEGTRIIRRAWGSRAAEDS